MRSIRRSTRALPITCGIAIFFLPLLLSSNVFGQSSHKYDFYRYPQRYGLSIDPLGLLLGRTGAAFEMRLDPNFTWIFELVYQRNVQDKNAELSYPEAAYTLGVRERIYLVDNAAMLGFFAGLGGGIGMVDKNFALRLTADIGYKFVFAHGTSNIYLEPMLLFDSYLITNRVGKRILPYIALPFGYVW